MKEAKYYKEQADNSRKMGAHQDAINSYETAITIDPHYWQAHANIALVFSGLNNHHKSIYHTTTALKYSPSSAYPKLYDNLGNEYRKTKDYTKAIKYHNQAIALDSKLSSAYYNLGRTYNESGERTLAENSYQKAIQLNPNLYQAINNLALIKKEKGLYQDALELNRRAVHVAPNNADNHYNLALTLLILEKLDDGWGEYEWRLQKKSHVRPTYNNKLLWDGSALDSKSILLYAEQGFGDSIQFIRYVRELSEYDCTILVQCHHSLILLFSCIKEIDRLIREDETLPKCDYYFPLLSLPFMLNTSIHSIPTGIPYIQPNINQSALRISSHNKLKIGVVWAGNKEQSNNKFRSTTLLQLLPIISLTNFQFFSLQVGERSKDIISLNADDLITDLSKVIHDFNDTALLIEQLDLIITVDTSVAHLAGAMGKPTWVLLSYNPDWRYFLNRNDSPWYPTMRLFRQKILGNWDNVIAEIIQSLSSKTDSYLTHTASPLHTNDRKK